MNQFERPVWWDDDDVAIAQLLQKSPVSDSARRSAHQFLLKSIASGLDARHSPLITADCSELVDGSPAMVQSATPTPASVSESQTSLQTTSMLYRARNRRAWLVISAMAASAVFGLFWWSSSAQLTSQQLVSICSDQLSQSKDWEDFHDQIETTEVAALTEILQKYLTSHPDGGMETRTLARTDISPNGRLWRIPVSGGSELYVFVYQSPRRIKKLDQRLQLLSGLSSGWSTAAVMSGDRLIVFMSKDDLKKSLRFMPLA